MADPADPRERAASFAGVADVYERARPGYPGEAVRWQVDGRPVPGARWTLVPGRHVFTVETRSGRSASATIDVW